MGLKSKAVPKFFRNSPCLFWEALFIILTLGLIACSQEQLSRKNVVD
jgi:hypothetical protein